MYSVCLEVMCPPTHTHFSLLYKLNTYFLQLGSLFSWHSQRKRKKLINYVFISIIFKLSGSSKMWYTFFRCQEHLQFFLENYGFCQKSGNDAFNRGWGEEVMLSVSLWRIAYENRYVAHPLYLNTFVTIEKMEPKAIMIKTVSQSIFP